MTTSPRRLGRIALGIVLLGAAVVATPIAAVVAFLAMATETSTFSFVLAATYGAAFVVAAGLGWLAALCLLRRRRWTLGIATPVVLVGLLAGITVPALFVPSGVTAAPRPPSTVEFWELPTGSRIAYTKVPAGGTPRPTPIIFLHGGPGTPGDHTVDQVENGLAKEGFDVYLYDQVGGGWSSRLSDVTQYTVERQLSDLEAIRAKIGAEKIILIGQSWGGTLAARYLAEHPDNVAKVVFSSPGALWEKAFAEGEEGEIWDRLTAQQQAKLDALETPRLLLWDILLQNNPALAHGMVSDAEIDSTFDELLSIAGSAASCKTGQTLAPPKNQSGYYVNQFTSADAANVSDPRPALRKLNTPALILRAECDYKNWPVTYDYKKTLPNSTLLYVPGAGHSIRDDAPQVYLSAVRAFLLGAELPLPAYTAATPPS